MVANGMPSADYHQGSNKTMNLKFEKKRACGSQNKTL